MDLGRRHTHPIHETGRGWQKSENRHATPLVVLGIILVPAWSAGVVGLSWVGLAGMGLGWALLWLAVTDARSYLLPDKITLPLIAAGLFSGYLLHPAVFLDHLIGAAAGYLVLWGVAAIFRELRGYPGLGLGDAKLFAAAGAWLTWQGLPTVLAIASFAGLSMVLASRLAGRPAAAQEFADKPIPFGPPLALGIWLVWLYGPLMAGGMS